MEINKDTVIDVEMQVANMSTFIERQSFYLVSTATNETKIIDSYINPRKIITISILCENIIKRNSYFNIAHMKFEKSDKETCINMGYKDEQETLTEQLEMIFIEIPKFLEKNPEAKGILNQWLYLIAGEEEKVKMAKDKYKEIEKAIEVIEEMSMDSKEWELYESRRQATIAYNIDMAGAKRQGIEEGKREGKKEGITEGEKRTKVEVIKKMLKEKIDINIISKVTGYSIEEINKINKII